ncbi:MAG: hypothetical protein U5N10_09065 [Gemmobacter sp.]|nr:hypothetical protein [Gemmobacter sp.]
MTGFAAGKGIALRDRYAKYRRGQNIMRNVHFRAKACLRRPDQGDGWMRPCLARA